MKKLLFIFAVIFSGCYQDEPRGTIIATGECVNGERKYYYQGNGSFYESFYDSCSKWKVGDNIFTNK